jgi:hypothetical protein
MKYHQSRSNDQLKQFRPFCDRGSAQTDGSKAALSHWERFSPSVGYRPGEEIDAGTFNHIKVTRRIAAWTLVHTREVEKAG